MSKKSQTYSTLKQRVEKDGIDLYYKLFDVRKPKHLMLCIIFDLIWNLRYSENSNNPDVVEHLKTQNAVFELACKHSKKQGV